MKKRLSAFAIGAIAVLGIAVGGWILLYPERGDPKNIRYVLWKAGLWKISLSEATGTMVHDADAKRLVVGKTREQLEAEFGGALLEVDKASPYQRNWYRTSAWNGSNSLILSPWLVVFDGPRATDMILIKG